MPSFYKEFNEFAMNEVALPLSTLHNSFLRLLDFLWGFLEEKGVG